MLKHSHIKHSYSLMPYTKLLSDAFTTFYFDHLLQKVKILKCRTLSWGSLFNPLWYYVDKSSAFDRQVADT